MVFSVFARAKARGNSVEIASPGSQRHRRLVSQAFHERFSSMADIKAIIFDYGRVLHDRETGGGWVEGAREVLDYCKSRYRLALVSLVKGEKPAQRMEKLVGAGFDGYFEVIDMVEDDKDSAFERTVEKLGVPHVNIALVDDRTIRGVRWGNQHGCTTIWLRRGKFANESPNQQTGEPTWTISDLRELKKIL